MKLTTTLALTFLLSMGALQNAARAEDSTPAPEQPKPVLECSKGEGTYLCNQMKEISSLFDYNCNGFACNELWNAQINEMSSFLQTYNSLTMSSFTAENDIAILAQSLSVKMCATTATGDISLVTNLAIKMNSTLWRLKVLQQAAKQPFNVLTCTISI